jgi:hypothetical protein
VGLLKAHKAEYEQRDEKRTVVFYIEYARWGPNLSLRSCIRTEWAVRAV